MNYKIWALLASVALVIQASAQSVTTVVVSNLFEPHSIASDSGNNLYLSDGANNRIAKFVPTTGVLTTLAGKIGVTGTNNGSGGAARFYQPQGIVAARGGLVVADSANHLIRYVTFSGVVSNLAGIASLVGGYADGPGDSAQFRFPEGLAADTNGNIFIADSQNGMIRELDTNNVVSTIATGLHLPAAVVVGDKGELWVADTRAHCIQHIDTNGVVTLAAGIPSSGGSEDSEDALSARFSYPSGLLWGGTTVGLLISDTGNNTVRRLFYNSDPGVLTNSVETLAGVAGTSGFLDGSPTVATFHSPIGLIRDNVNGGFYIVDSGNNALRRLQTSPPLPPVSDPVLGYVTFPLNDLGQPVSLFNASSDAVFNNDTIIAIKAENGTETYITSGTTPPSIFEDTIPSPGPTTGQNPVIYRGDGLPPPPFTAPTIVQPLADLTVKAIGVQDGRQPSAVVKSRFQFKTANPAITGDNAAALYINNITTNSSMWYTVDGTDPTNATPSIGPIISGDKISLNIVTNTVLKIRAFRTDYKPSDTITKVLSPTNFVVNKLTFGFASGEASSDFIAAAGQRFYAPITLTLLQGETIYSMQFNVTVSNLVAAPAITPGAFTFQSMLEKAVPGTSPQEWIQIPPAMFVGLDTNGLVPVDAFEDLVFTNTAENLLGVGWFERFHETHLYDTESQTLISHSRAHDNQFDGAAQKVIVGGYSFMVPTNANSGDQYQIQLGRPSGSEDGISRSVLIQSPTNGTVYGGTLNGTKYVTVGSRQYIVGDVAPFRWFNAGDFGNTNLENVDVLQVFESVVYWSAPTNGYVFLGPPAGSDFFDAMDASDGAHNGIFNGDDTTIDNIQYGDGSLNVDDIYVTFRRSLDPALKWYARYWSNGVLQVTTVSNIVTSKVAPKTADPAKLVRRKSSDFSVAVSADNVVGNAGTAAAVPITAKISGGLPVRVMMMNLSVTPLEGSPPLETNSIQFTAGGDLGTPTLVGSQSANGYAATWLNSQITGINGTNVLGTLNVTLPANCTSNSVYLVHFNHLSTSPNGLALFPTTTQDFYITLRDRSGSSLNDGIPDFWRLRNFGAVYAPFAGANIDADGDGVSNYGEYVAGTNPADPSSRLKLIILGPQNGNGATLSWPSVLNKMYFLESAPDLSGGWTILSSNVGDGFLQQFIHTNNSTDNQFYRLRVQP